MSSLLQYLPSWRARRCGGSKALDVVPVEAPLDTKQSKEDSDAESLTLKEITTAIDSSLNPGELTFEEDSAGGMGRHLGVFSCTLLNVGCIIGTGIFSTPSSILGSVGSVGASLMLWVLGFVLSFCGCIVFAQNILIVAGHSADRWVTRGIALGVIGFATLLHGLTPRLGVWVMNGLSVFKIIILLFVVITGWVVLSGKTHIEDPYANFRDAFAGSSHSSNDYATATFKVLSAYAGWSYVNYVMNNVKNPVRTLKIAGPLGLGICAVLYLLANVSYFAAATKDEILHSGTTVASLFFKNVFGVQAQKALTVLCSGVSFKPVKRGKYKSQWNCLVYFNPYRNVVTVTFAAARINQELAKEGIPLPFGNRFWASNWPTGKSPLPGLIIHLIPSVIVIIGPPSSVAYPFILDLQGYPGQIISLFVVLGLFWLRYSKPNAPRPFKVWWPLAVFFLAAAIFLLVAPFLRPANGEGDTPPLPYYLYCLVGIAITALGVLYWAVWRIVPRWFGVEYVPRKEVLADGTVVTLFSRQKIE
ncbi:hypothetical protein VTO73DRAFT_10440 [Trametes versicolor]